MSQIGRGYGAATSRRGGCSSPRRNVVAIERARSRRGRTDENEALRTWRALLAGEYTVIDRFESDGRRYVVAFTVQKQLENIYRKLGVGSRAALVRAIS